MPTPTTGHDRITPLIPTASLLDFTLLIDLGAVMSAGWWAVAEDTNGRRMRVYKDDEVTELPVDVIEYDHATQTGMIRVKFTGTLSSLGGDTIYVYPPVSANSVQLSNAAGGSDFAYKVENESYYPCKTDLLNRTVTGGEMLIAGASGDAMHEAVGPTGGAITLRGARYAVEDKGSLFYDGDTDLTVMCWMKADSPRVGTHLFGLSTEVDLDAGRTLFFRNSGESNIIGIFDRAGAEINDIAVDGMPYAWQHIALRLNPSEMEAFIDGVGTGSPAVNTNGAAQYLRYNQLGGNFTQEGSRAEFAVFRESLSDAWIKHEFEQVENQSSFWSPGEFIPAGAETPAIDPAINLNLSKTVLPTREASQITKVGIVHDSQGLRQSNRWVGQVGKWSMNHVGMMVYAVNQSGVGPFFSQETTVSGAAIAHTRLNPGDDWGDGNTTDHLMWSNRAQITGTISPNFQELCRYGMSVGGFTNTPDVDARHFCRAITRDSAGTFERYRLSEFRGSSGGNSDDFGLASDPGGAFDKSGAIRVRGFVTRNEGSLGNPGDTVGTIIRDSNAGDTDDAMMILGVLIYQSPANEDFTSTGLIVSNTGYSGWSADDHINNQSMAAKEAMAEAHDGLDTVIIMLGHNAEGAGTFQGNLTTLIEQWKTAHTNKGYATPSFLLIAPWNAAGANMTQQKNDEMRAVATAGGHGFISLWESYGGESPAGRVARLDGAAATYTLDPIHPSDSSTAENIAKDIEWHFQPENWASSLSQSVGAVIHSAQPFTIQLASPGLVI